MYWTDLVLQYTNETWEDRRVFVLYKPFMFQCSRWSIVVPKGTKTDGASIPWIFRLIFPPTGEYMPAAVVHDYLYEKQFCTRNEADVTFDVIMFCLGVPRWKRWCLYKAVCYFGGYYWRKRSEQITRGN